MNPPAGGLRDAPLRIGATYWIGPEAGVQFGFRPIYFRLSNIVSTDQQSSTPAGLVWLYGYELTERGDATDRREVLVIQAGLLQVDETEVFPSVPPAGRQVVRRVRLPRAPAPARSV